MDVAKYPFWIIRGIPVDFWHRYVDIIGNYIKENKLNPVDQATLVTQGDLAFTAIMAGQMASPAAAPKAAGETLITRLINPRGGMKIPHLHYKGETYILTPEQWQKFSGQIMKDVQARIAKASAVSFDQLLDVSQAVNSLA
jgi:hypothetical protein